MRVFSITEHNKKEAIDEAVYALQHSSSIVYPTDTVYGLGVNPFDDFIVGRLFRIKKRPSSKPVPLIVKNLAMAKKLAYIDPTKEKILRSVWPGPVTVVLYKKSIISSLISSGTQTVALRIPDSDFCMRLIRQFDSPITSTSANISGERSVNDSKEIIDRFKYEAYKPDLIIDKGILETRQPSTVLDLTKEKPKITRIGPVTPSELSSLLSL